MTKTRMKMQMKLWVLLLLMGFCFQRGSLSPESPPTCESPEVIKAAELALDKINTDRQEGYIFGFNRVHDVQEHNVTGGVEYNLIIDVLETKCDVISKKNQSSCEIRGVPDVPKYGNCETNVFVDSAEQNVKLYNYSCTIRPVPPRVIVRMCPDCPIGISFDDPKVLKAADLSLKKFNKISGLPHYFALLKVTRALMQWVFGPAYFVKFTIQETVCARESPGTGVSQCKLMDCEFAHTGHCTGSHLEIYREVGMGFGPVKRRMPPKPPEMDQILDVDCEIFEPEARKPEKNNHTQEGVQRSESDKEQKPADQSHKHELPKASNNCHSQSETRAPLGSVNVLPAPDLPAPARAPPTASGCPGKRTHDFHFSNFEI